jgi:DNA-binding transcriptional ArsR family regulator
MTTMSRRGDDRADPITNIDDARYVKAMSHPLRVRILALLDERTASPVELAGWLGATLGTVA